MSLGGCAFYRRLTRFTNRQPCGQRVAVSIGCLAVALGQNHELFHARIARDPGAVRRVFQGKSDFSHLCRPHFSHCLQPLSTLDHAVVHFFEPTDIQLNKLIERGIISIIEQH